MGRQLSPVQPITRQRIKVQTIIPHRHALKIPNPALCIVQSHRSGLCRIGHLHPNAHYLPGQGRHVPSSTAIVLIHAEDHRALLGNLHIVAQVIVSVGDEGFERWNPRSIGRRGGQLFSIRSNQRCDASIHRVDHGMQSGWIEGLREDGTVMGQVALPPLGNIQ